MSQMELEKKLKRASWTRHGMVIALTVLFAVLGIVFTALRANSRQEEVIGEGVLNYVSVTYNQTYTVCMIVGFVGALICGIVMIMDWLFFDYRVIRLTDSIITFYHGAFVLDLYIDGELADKLVLIGYYLEGKLKDGSLVHLSLGKWSGRMTFSNGHQPIDIDLIRGGEKYIELG